MIPDYEQRLDELFSKAFKSSDPAMKDWVKVKFELRELRLFLKNVDDEAEKVFNEKQ